MSLISEENNTKGNTNLSLFTINNLGKPSTNNSQIWHWHRQKIWCACRQGKSKCDDYTGLEVGVALWLDLIWNTSFMIKSRCTGQAVVAYIPGFFAVKGLLVKIVVVISVYKSMARNLAAAFCPLVMSSLKRNNNGWEENIWR